VSALERRPAGLRVGVDVGGTFTDIVLSDGGSKVLSIVKLPSTKSADSTMNGIAELLRQEGAVRPDEISVVAHSSTLATNAVIEGSANEVALLTTRGFRDVLEIRRLGRPAAYLYDIFVRMPPPLVRRSLRFEITERVGWDGSVLQPLAAEEVRAVARQLEELEIKSVAVCYLFSFLRPDHEQETAAILAECLPDVDVVLSSAVLPEFREYERTSSTVLNALLRPVVRSYLPDLEARLAGDEAQLVAKLHVLQSNGGLTSPTVALERPASLLLSGPSGGVVASCALARELGLSDVLAVDMGGTSFDVSLVQSGEPQTTEDRMILENPIRLPMLDIHTIGAGGGSIAWADDVGGLHVGPRSAGSLPGPACYGNGGTEPTVTDANVVLSLLADTSRLGGSMTLRTELAEEACERLGNELGLGITEVAIGIRRVVNASMAGAIRAVTVEKGRDPRDFALLAYGGAGPMHAAELLLDLEMSWLIVPEYPGCFSAQGATATNIRHDYARSLVTAVDQLEIGLLAQSFAALAAQAERELEIDGIPEASRDHQRLLELRYKGQSFGINIPAPAGEIDSAFVDECVARFHATHEELYGFNVSDARTELVNIRLVAYGSLAGGEPAAIENDAARRPYDGPRGERSIVLPRDGEITASIVARTDLEPGHVLRGPLVIEQLDATTVVPPELVVTVLPNRSLVIGREEWRRH
jgi:N-methylhydantoinase A